MPDYKLCLADATQCSPLADDIANDPIVQSVRNASQGGSNTQNYFSSVNNYYYLLQNLVKGGSDAWNTAPDENDLPVHYLKSEDDEGNSYYVEILLNGLDVKGDGNVNPNGTTRSSGGVTYQGIGAINATIGYNSTPWSQITWWVGVGSIGSVLTKVSWEILSPMLGPLLRSIATQFASTISRVAGLDVSTAAELEEGIEMADFEATTAIGEEVGADVAIAAAGISAGTLCFIGIGVGIAIICLALFLILHNSYHRLRLWNLTRYNLKWEMFLDEGDLVSGPVKFDSNSKIQSYNILKHVCGGSPVPGTKAVPQAHYYDFSINSDSEWHGVGYAMRFKFLDPKDDKTVVYECTLMFDIPLIGDNSTSVTFNGVTNLSAYYESEEGDHKSTRQVATSSDSKITATTTYDFLGGKHVIPSGDTGSTNEEYFYQSLITFEEKGLNSKNLPTCPQKKS